MDLPFHFSFKKKFKPSTQVQHQSEPISIFFSHPFEIFHPFLMIFFIHLIRATSGQIGVGDHLGRLASGQPIFECTSDRKLIFYSISISF
jgi:hypothetical protein